MMKKIEDVKKIFATLLVVALSTNTFAQNVDEDPEIAAQRAMFESAKKSGANEVSGGACKKFISKKRWKIGQNFKKNGDPFFIAIGISEVKAPIVSTSYATSTMNGSILAQLDSKRALVESMGSELTSEILATSVQQYSEGNKPDFLNTSDKPAKEIQNYEDLSVYQKTKVLFNQQLDKLIDQETKDAIANDSISEKEVEDKLKDILNQSAFKDSIKTKASGSIRGMKSVYSHFSVNKGQKQTIICNVGIWSDNLAAQTDAMITGNYSSLKNLKKGKPLEKYIPNDENFEGYVDLLGTFGTFMVRDETGQMSVLSYAQEGIKSAASERMAFNNAATRARRAIIQLREENIEVTSSVDKQETTTESADGMIDYWSEEKSKNRIAASASGTLKGDYEVKRWKNIHTQSQKPVAGIVIAWTPSGAEYMNKVSKTLSEAPVAGSGSNSADFTSAESDADGGSSAGDDEDDF
jgi:hypothetical protein